MTYLKNMGGLVKAFHKKLLQKTGNHSKQLWGYVKHQKKLAVASVATIGILVAGSAFANEIYQANVQVLYRVYLNDKPVGTVDNPKIVNDWIHSEIEKWKDIDPTLNYRLDGEITYTIEKVFRGESENNKVISRLAELTDVKAEATELIIDGEAVGYVTNESVVSEIMQEVKQEFTGVPLAQNKKSAVAIASYSTGGDKEIVDVSIKEHVETKKKLVSPDELLTKDEMKQVLKEGTLKKKEYEIREGDCLSCVADKFDMTTEELLKNNPGLTENSLLKIGDKLDVTSKEPKLTVLSREKVRKVEKIDYGIEYRESDSMFKGETKVIREGKEGKKQVTYDITKENGIEIGRKVIGNEILSEPVDKIVVRGTKVIASRGSGRFAWPTNGGRISSGYGPRWGKFHKGIDIASASSRTIKAADNGRVVQAGWNGDYGKSVIIDHGNGYETLYGHLSSISVTEGQVVEKGQKIGVMGSTGDSTGVHLHFEVIRNGRSVNPLNFVRR